MPTRLPISAAAELGKKFGLKTIVLHAWDGALQHLVSWGDTVQNCDYAAQAAALMEKAFDWQGVEERLPSRVKALKAEVAKLKADVATLNDRLHERTQALLNELDEERRARQAGFAHWPVKPVGQPYPVVITETRRDERPPGSDAVDFDTRPPTRKEREDEALLHRAGMCSHAIRQSAIDPSRCWTCQVVGLPIQPSTLPRHAP